MSEQRLLAREAFKRAVFARDLGACVICGAPAVDAHHILDRKLFSDGGYYLGNGASLCSPCHLQAEMTTISVETIRAVCAIATPVLPEGLDPTQDYDKWGNALLAGGLRRPDQCSRMVAHARSWPAPVFSTWFSPFHRRDGSLAQMVRAADF